MCTGVNYDDYNRGCVVEKKGVHFESIFQPNWSMNNLACGLSKNFKKDGCKK
jgi:hypothetical protein